MLDIRIMSVLGFAYLYMKDKRVLIIGLLVTVLLIAIPLTVYIANQQQDVRSSAQVPNTSDVALTATNTPAATPTNIPTSTTAPTPTFSPAPSPTLIAAAATVTPVSGGACQTPAVVSSVELNYPSCQGTQCNFSEASCTWAAVNGAVSYSVKVTQIESGAITKTTTVTAPTVTDTFPVEQGKTYRCDIAAINSCGTSGEAGSAQALCSVDGQVAQPTTSTQPTTPQVIPTVVPTGDTNTTILVGIGGLVVAILGGALFFFSGI